MPQGDRRLHEGRAASGDAHDARRREDRAVRQVRVRRRGCRRKEDPRAQEVRAMARAPARLHAPHPRHRARRGAPRRRDAQDAEHRPPPLRRQGVAREDIQAPLAVRPGAHLRALPGVDRVGSVDPPRDGRQDDEHRPGAQEALRRGGEEEGVRPRHLHAQLRAEEAGVPQADQRGHAGEHQAHRVREELRRPQRERRGPVREGRAAEADAHAGRPGVRQAGRLLRRDYGRGDAGRDGRDRDARRRQDLHGSG